MNTKKIVSLEKNLPYVHDTLRKLAWDVAKRTPLSFEEALSEAYWLYIKACGHWEPGHGASFNTWIYCYVSLNLRAMIAKKTKDADRLALIEINDEILPGKEDPQNEFANHIMQLVSEDARHIIGMLIDTPAELYQEMAEIPKTGHQLLRCVTSYMQKAGWSRNRLEKAKREIREQVCALT